MKSLLPILHFIFFAAFAQKTSAQSDNPADFSFVTNAKTYGYIAGIRLDSVDAVYAEFNRYSGEGLFFDYGQRREKRKELRITDQWGKPLLFVPYTNALFLNFLYFNGWQLDNMTSAADGGIGVFIIKRKQQKDS